MRVDSYASSTDGQTNNLYQNSNIMMENRQQRADDSDNHHHHAYAESNVETSSLLSSSFHPRQHDSSNSQITSLTDLSSLWLSGPLSDLEF